MEYFWFIGGGLLAGFLVLVCAVAYDSYQTKRHR